MCLNDKEFTIEFLTVNFVTLLSIWGEIFAVFTDLPKNRENKLRKIFLPTKYVEWLKVLHYISKTFTNENEKKKTFKHPLQFHIQNSGNQSG